MTDAEYLFSVWNGTGLILYWLFASDSSAGSFCGSMNSTLTLPPARNLIFLEQIAQARHQRRQQWMGLRAEIAADQKRLLNLPQIGFCLA